MSERVKKEKSTAQRIQAMHARRMSAMLFVVNAVAVALALAGWCYVNDSAYFGEFNPFELFHSVARQVEFVGSAVYYTMRADELEPLSVNASSFFYVLLFALLLLTLIELIAVGISNATGAGQIRRQLKPLYRLAQTAQELSDEEFKPEPVKPIPPTININLGSRGAGKPAAAAEEKSEDERIHTLESAIEDFRPERPDAELHTGDKDLKGLENAINSLLARTRESYGQQIRFVSDASHELRTPIAVIKGYTDMLDRWGKQDEKILEESIAAIKSETEHMNRLVEQLLFLARGDSGRQKLKFELFSLSDMLREVYEESVMIDAGHEWRLCAADEVIAYGDAAMLKQATRILVDNAAKYTPEGETILIRAQRDDKGAPAIVVQDSGIGIAQSDMAHVFERFYRSDPSRTRQQGGTGLGLAIAKWIVDRHDGYFDILSREELGTRFTVHLPKPPEATAGAPE